MRSPISRYRLRCLTQAATIALLAGVGAGCSSDFTRFDRDLYSALPRSANQQANPQNPYPGVDPTTTASVNGNASGVPTPLGDVSMPRSISDDGAYQPASVQNPYPSGPGIRRPLEQQAAQRSPYQPAVANRSGVVRQSLPDPAMQQSSPAPRVDPVSTGSVANPVTPAPATNVAGWSATGGTAITLRSGETLYNLSKRYGVPVNAIVKANNLRSADSVQAGQRIVIPTYVYSQSAPVSAPDNDPKTRASRASRGLQGQADPSRVTVPTKRPVQTAALNQPVVNESNDSLAPRYKPKPRVKDETEQTVPDYSIVTGSVSKPGSVPLDGVYTVKSGDSLSKIAGMTGVSTKALMDANGLDNSVIRVGQTLRIPGSGETVGPRPATNKASPAQTVRSGEPRKYVKPTVDQTVTSSTDTKAPATTGISSLRWPVRGRIVSGFGATRNGAKNDGIDISVPVGTNVHAAENGVVIYSGNELEEFGNLVLVRHADGYVTAYAHNSSNDVSKGETVKRGQVIAKSGKTGKTDTPVLHFEVRKNSKPVNPVNYLGG